MQVSIKFPVPLNNKTDQLSSIMSENVKKSLIRGVVITNSVGYMDISDLSGDIISATRGVLVTLNGQWGTAGVLNAVLEKPQKRIYIKTNLGTNDNITYTISFAVLLI